VGGRGFRNSTWNRGERVQCGRGSQSNVIKESRPTQTAELGHEEVQRSSEGRGASCGTWESLSILLNQFGPEKVIVAAWSGKKPPFNIQQEKEKKN